MPYDQEKDAKLDVSGSAPIQKPRQAPPPAPKEFTAGQEDDSVVKLAYELNEEKNKLNEETMTQGRQAGFSKTSVDEIVKEK